ncbi:MAG: 3-hydroxyacyl-CoA dehydrogenase, partial [Burkholderiaceae bacterium]|nr:3-hydroxyacyl-CoA dehydrogenase [Burkholderiaceae bacterium]
LDMVIAGKSGVKTMQGYWQWTPEKVKALKAIYSKRLKAAFAVLKMEL